MPTEIARPVEVPVLDDDPFDPENLRDPYPMYARLREAGPVVYLPSCRHYAVARHTEVAAVLKDWQTFSSAAGVGLQDPREPGYFRAPGLLLEQDPPDHARFRKVFTPILAAPSVRRLREGAEQRARALVDGLLARGTVDAVRDLAEVFPLQVLPDAIGLPVEGRELLLPMGELVFNGFGPPNELFGAALERAAEARAWVARCMLRENLASVGYGATIYGFADEGTITEHEAGMLVRNFLTAGIDTTVSALSGALFHLAADPTQWAALRADPALARLAFEETVRMLTPVQVMARSCTRPARIGDAELPPGARVLVFFGSANRDPARWKDPDRFDVHRRPAGHLGFGSGVHSCLGQIAARLQGEVMVAELARRVERIELVGDPVWRLNNVMRGLGSLPVRLVAA
ncbi:cytochrome P450 [Pseudonocardia halophobica]|uniref:Cytochrome P450 n=1 Tax=Pseudonocardia halophobica TaxID=29401 RepID=A0A9W6P0C7_9PSEU|nr:cytochrome P450 [Pseudonocardia halophobica]GLL15527.1 cytochrome P450 [Pseudonocardia halophobica]